MYCYINSNWTPIFIVYPVKGSETFPSFNPYCQIIEKSSRTFSEILILWARPFNWKTHSIFFEISICITCAEVHDWCRNWFVSKLMKFFEICAEVLVPKFTRAEVRLPGPYYWKTHPFDFFDWNNIWSVTYQMKHLVWMKFQWYGLCHAACLKPHNSWNIIFD